MFTVSSSSNGVTHLRLSGNLDGQAVSQLQTICDGHLAVKPGEALILDLQELRKVSAAGHLALVMLRNQGVQLTNTTSLFERLLDSYGGRER